MQNRISAVAKYNSIVESNKDLISSYVDPDQTFEEEISMNSFIFFKSKESKELCIRLSSDGICGISKIKKFSSIDDVNKNYKLLRDGMFECLIWPSYSISINQARGWKVTCDDRLDLTLIDIQAFYKIINQENKSDLELIEEIWEKCCMARAYINIITFNWLSSYENFNNFIIRRKLQVFVNKDELGNYTAEKWTEGIIFDQEYFDKLLLNVQIYKNDICALRAINSIV